MSSPTNILRTITAFANTAGGTLIIGVEDTSRFIVGIKEPHQFEEKLASLISDTIAPHLFPEIDTIPWRDLYLLVVRVYPSPTRPHYYKKFGPKEGVYIRVGSTNRKADQEMIQELSRIVRNETFDEQRLAKLSSEDIDFSAASEQFDKIKQLTQKNLETLEILVDYHGKKYQQLQD